MTATVSPLPVPGPVPSACLDADEMEARGREDRRREDAALAADVLAKMRAGREAPEPDVQTCSVSDCNRTIHARGWCGRHYQRWVRYGDPERAAAKVRCSSPGCPVWTTRGVCYAHKRAKPPRLGTDANPWAGQCPCPSCGSDLWTLPYDFGTDLWRCVACHLFFTVAALRNGQAT